MEIWKDINDYEGLYQVSNQGRIKSLDCMIQKSNNVTYMRKGRYLSLHKNQDGYLQVKLCKNGSYKTFRVHVLVASAFLHKPKSNGCEYEINHKDCNRQNNYVENLEWCSHYKNVHIAIQQKHHVCTRDLRGKNNPNYGNHKLAEIYAANPMLAIQKLSRPKSQNGRSKQVALFDCNHQFIQSFDWIGGCAEYLRDYHLTNASVKSIRGNISQAILKNTKYLNHYFQFV